MGNLSKLLPNVGSMDQLINILSGIETTDSTGGVSTAWSNLATDIWSRVEYTAQSSEGMRGEDQQIVAFRIVKFTFRDFWTINEKMRIVFDGDEYDILNISRLGRSRFAIVEAEKRDNETS